MSQTNQTLKGRALPFALLLGALGFSLSSLPGAYSKAAQSADFSSVSGKLEMCDLSALGRSGEAECRIASTTNSHASTRIIIKRAKNSATSDDMTLGSNQAKAKPDSGDLNFDVTTETECTACDFRTEPHTVPIHESRQSTYGDLKMDLRRIVTAAQKDFDKQLREKKQKDADIKSCKKDDDGNVLKGSAILDCKMDQFSNLDDDKKEAYFENNLKGKIKALIESGKPEDQAEAAKLIQEVGENTSSAKTLASIADLTRYGQYRAQVNVLAYKINSLNRFAKFNPNYAKARQGLLNQLHSLESTQGLHYAQEGFITSPVSSSLLANGTNLNNVSSAGSAYETQLNAMYSKYDAVVNQHSQIINATLRQGVKRGSDARRMRGALGPWPAATTPAVGTPATVRAGVTAPQSVKAPATTQPVTSTAFTIPTLGQRVH